MEERPISRCSAGETLTLPGGLTKPPDDFRADEVHRVAMDGPVFGTRQNYHYLVLRALEVHWIGFTHHQRAHFALDGVAGQAIDSGAEIACTDSKATFRKIRACPLSNMLRQFSICDACVQPDSSSTAQDLVEQGGSGEAADRRIGMRDVDHPRMDDFERSC